MPADAVHLKLRHSILAATLILGALTVLGPVTYGQSARPGMGPIPYADPGGTGTTFRVWAPHATAVGVKGQFNGWGTTPLVAEGNGLWSLDIPAARPGHEYKYRINNSFDKRDPRARRVTNSSGNSIIYDFQAFDWGTVAVSPPGLKDLVIYEMHVGTYNAETWVPSTFDKVIERLDHLQKLGVSAVQVMPICEFPTDKSWGYNPADPFAVESALGGPDAFKRFVKSCHARGMAVLVDVVHNHYGPSDLDLWQFDGWSQNGLGGIYFYNDAARASTYWGNTRPDYGRAQVRQYIRDQIFMWLNEYRVDGFRWDSVFSIIYYNNGANHNPDGESLLREINGEIQQTHPGTIRIAEDHAFDFSMNFDSQWHVAFHDNLKAEIIKTSDANRNMSTLASLLNGWPSHNRVIFSESHDTVGDLNGKVRLPRDIDSSNPESLSARKRALLAAGFVLTAPGVPMIFQGQEMHETQTFSSEQSLRWNLTNTYAGIVRAYRDLIRLRRNLEGATQGLKGTGVNVHQVDNTRKILAYTRWDAGGGADDVVVVANFSGTRWTNQNYVVQFPSTGTWYSCFNGDSTNYQADFGHIGPVSVVATGYPPRAPVNMGAYSLQIFSKSRPTLTSGSVTFQPAAPSGCIEITITYNPLDHPLKNAQQVYARLGRNNWQNAVDVTMTAVAGGNWRCTRTLAPGTYRLDAVFHDGAGVWDNNGGAGWLLVVENCPAGAPSEVTVEPAQPQGCVPLGITYHPNEGPLLGATNIYLHIGRNGWVDVLDPPPALIEGPAGTWGAEYPIPPGTRRVNFVFHNGQGTWDNNFGRDWAVAVSHCIGTLPGLAITNPPGPVTVPHAVGFQTLSGTASVAVVEQLIWSNHLSGASGYSPAGTQWSLSDIPLQVGTNILSVTGRAGPPGAAWDAASNLAYRAGWTNGSNGGVGWGGGWIFLGASANAGHFLASRPESYNLSLADYAWGLWANSGAAAEVRRPFGAPLRPGDTMNLVLDNNWIQTGGSVGVSWQNDDARNLVELYFVGGETTYRLNDREPGRNTGVGWTGSGLEVAFSLVDSTQYVLRLGSTILTGVLAQAAVTNLTALRAWNFNAGPGTDYNFYISKMQITPADVGPAEEVHDSVTVIREPAETDTDGDGLPDWWEEAYFGSPTGAVSDADDDGDGHPNREEYVADTNPTNPGSFYPNRILTAWMTDNQLVHFLVGPPTTNSRIYDVIGCSNLLLPNWTAFQLDRRGRADGGELLLTVTNDSTLMFYRTAVKVP